MDNSDDVNDPIKDFYDSASNYCLWAEIDSNDKKKELFSALSFLSSLYYKALFLPIVEMEEEISGRKLSKMQYSNIYKRFSSLPVHKYFEVYNPLTIKPEKPTAGDIADDLMDIYLDIKEGMLLYEQGKINEAVFFWKFSFGIHWGYHITSALKVLHFFATKP